MRDCRDASLVVRIRRNDNHLELDDVYYIWEDGHVSYDISPIDRMVAVQAFLNRAESLAGLQPCWYQWTTITPPASLSE